MCRGRVREVGKVDCICVGRRRGLVEGWGTRGKGMARGRQRGSRREIMGGHSFVICMHSTFPVSRIEYLKADFISMANSPPQDLDSRVQDSSSSLSNFTNSSHPTTHIVYTSRTGLRYITVSTVFAQTAHSALISFSKYSA